MDATLTALIDKMKSKALKNERQDRKDILTLLSMDPTCEESKYLAAAAKEVALNPRVGSPV